MNETAWKLCNGNIQNAMGRSKENYRSEMSVLVGQTENMLTREDLCERHEILQLDAVNFFMKQPNIQVAALWVQVLEWGYGQCCSFLKGLFPASPFLNFAKRALFWRRSIAFDEPVRLCGKSEEQLKEHTEILKEVNRSNVLIENPQ